MKPRTPKQAQVKTVEKVFLSNKEAMKYLDVGETTLKNWRASLMLPFYKIGSLIWYEKAELDKFIKKFG